MSTQANGGQRLYTTSPTLASTYGGYASLAPSLATPTPSLTNGVYGALSGPAPLVPDLVIVMPFGTAANNKTGTFRVVGLKLFGDLWKEVPLYEGDCTISDKCGGKSTSVLGQTDTEYSADTIVPTSAFSALEGVAFSTSSPANDTPGHVTIDRKGCPFIFIEGKKGDMTAMNFLVADVTGK